MSTQTLIFVREAKSEAILFNSLKNQTNMTGVNWGNLTSYLSDINQFWHYHNKTGIKYVRASSLPCIEEYILVYQTTQDI